jgi:hypothetical protein
MTEFLDKDKNFKALKRQFSKAILPNNKENFVFNAEEYLHKKYSNQVAFAVKDFIFNENENKANLEVYLGLYYEFLNTSMLFQYETVYECMHKKCLTPSQNSIRKKYDLLDTTNRFADIGISVLTIFNNIIKNGTPCCMMLLHTRSADVAISPNQIHVVPAGSYQPATITENDSQEKINDLLKSKAEHLMLTVKREFAEEVLNVDEATILRNSTVLDEILKQHKLENAFEDTYLLGCGFSSLSMKFEIFAVSVIDVNKTGIGNTEQEIIGNIKNNYEGTITLKPFNIDRLRQYKDQPTATTVLKSAFQIIIDDYDNIVNQLNLINV